MRDLDFTVVILSNSSNMIAPWQGYLPSPRLFWGVGNLCVSIAKHTHRDLSLSFVNRGKQIFRPTIPTTVLFPRHE